MKKKVFYIVSSVDRAIAFEWISKYLDSKRFDLSFVLINCPNSALEKFLLEQKIPCYSYAFQSKPAMLFTLIRLVALLFKKQPDIVHTHLKDASFLGLTAAKLAGIRQRIITRHHSTYHHKYFPKAVKWDLWSNSMATKLVAISKVVEKVLNTEGVSDKKIELIHHGFELKQFSEVEENRVNAMASKYGVRKNAPVIGVIARYIEWKGIEFTLRAFIELRKSYPDAQIVLANAHGPYQSQLQPYLEQIPPANRVEIKFESDLFALYRLFDVFVHCPVDADVEAFGQIYVEALAAGVPSIFSLSGVAHEFIEDEENALVVAYKDSQAIESAMKRLLTDQSLVEKLRQSGKQAVQSFSVEQFVANLEDLYS